MKVEVNKKEKQFEPIELVITIESEEELKSLVEATSKVYRITRFVEDENHKDIMSDFFQKIFNNLLKYKEK